MRLECEKCNKVDLIQSKALGGFTLAMVTSIRKYTGLGLMEAVVLTHHLNKDKTCWRCDSGLIGKPGEICKRCSELNLNW